MVLPRAGAVLRPKFGPEWALSILEHQKLNLDGRLQIP